MTFLSSLNFNLNFCIGMRNIFIPSFSHFDFIIPNYFSCIRMPKLPVFPSLTSVWQGWTYRPIATPNISGYRIPVLNYNSLPTPALKPPENYLQRFSSNNYHATDILPTPALKEPKIDKTTRKYVSSKGKNIDNSYLSLSQIQAEKKAKTDANLERLSGGRNWSVSKTSFKTDIPYAKKGTGKILDKVSDMIGEKLVITSALGTGQAGNPHVKGGYASHHNAENPKLDIRTNGHGRELAAKLKATGYFSRVSLESDHLDVQIDPSKYESFNALA